MSKFLFSTYFHLFIFISTLNILYSMPGTEQADQMPSDEIPSEEISIAPMSEESPTPTIPGSIPTIPGSMPTIPVPSADTQPSQTQPSIPSEEVKTEQLGDFEIKEDLSSIIKNTNPDIVNLIRKANDLSKQINEVTTDIQKIKDALFNKFTETNNMLDNFYQKIGFECGKMKESLKEEK